MSKVYYQCSRAWNKAHAVLKLLTSLIGAVADLLITMANPG